MHFWIGVLVGVIVTDITLTFLARWVLPYYLSREAGRELDSILRVGLLSALKLRPHRKED